MHMLAAILGAQALEENWSAFPCTIRNPTVALANSNRNYYGAMNALSLYTPMYTWQDVLNDLRTSPNNPAANIRRGLSALTPKQVKIVKFKDGILPVDGISQRGKRKNADAGARPREAARRRVDVDDARPDNDDADVMPPNSIDNDEP